MSSSKVFFLIPFVLFLWNQDARDALCKVRRELDMGKCKYFYLLSSPAFKDIKMCFIKAKKSEDVFAFRAVIYFRSIKKFVPFV